MGVPQYHDGSFHEILLGEVTVGIVFSVITFQVLDHSKLHSFVQTTSEQGIPLNSLNVSTILTGFNVGALELKKIHFT